MRLLDCTLRDGGHSVGFDWPIDMAKEYYQLMCEIGIDIVELGYWKQTSKFTTPFFNLNMDTVLKVVDGVELNNVSIMIDYHYCLKDLNEYPRNDQNIIKIIRICSRKHDLHNALEFATALKKHTGLEISINVFNVSNYSRVEIIEAAKQICKYDLDYAYFADTHGNLDMMQDSTLFDDAIRMLCDHGKKVGMHFHNHTGKEYSNFLNIHRTGIHMTDVTIHGVGKGAGNLKLEHALREKDKCLKIISFIHKYFHILKRDFSTYFYVTGLFGICESYATQAQKADMPLDKFIEFCEGLDIIARDIYNNALLKEFA